MDPAQQPLQPYVPAGQTAQPSAVSGVAGSASTTAANPFMPPASPMSTPPASQTGLPAQPLYNPAANSAQPPSSNLFPPITTDQTYGPLPAAPPANPLATEPLPGNVKQELVGHLKKANNVLVTVSSNPSVDQLASAIGLTLVLNKLGKHATAVFSGKTPSTIEFLQPEKTIEKNTDSLRDFIIALDKAKADKLRYKVEDKFVKIFITPFHTSLSENDLEFSQGDFNVDVIIALGVRQREELDQAITAHGRILHDAVTVSINNKHQADLGALNWFQPDSSSLCEMVVGLIEPLQGEKAILDTQISTAFLTGVVAETERFSNAKTTPLTMNVAATLMKAGANQQLVASKLEIPKEIPQKEADAEPAKETSLPAPVKANDGSLEIEHKEEENKDSNGKTLADLESENKSGSDEEEDSDLAKIHIDSQGKIMPYDKLKEEADKPKTTNMVLTPPTMGGDLSSVMKPGPVESPVEPMKDSEVIDHGRTIQPLSESDKEQTLADLEKSVDSPHSESTEYDTAPAVSDASAPAPADSARLAVDEAINSVEPPVLEPIEALNAQPVDLEQNSTESSSEEQTENVPETNEEAFPPQLVGPDKGLPPDPTAGASDPASPPTVPPPFVPPSAE